MFLIEIKAETARSLKLGLSRAVFKLREGKDRVTAMGYLRPTLSVASSASVSSVRAAFVSELRCLYSKRLGFPCVRVGNTERFLHVVDCIFTPSFLKLTEILGLGMIYKPISKDNSVNIQKYLPTASCTLGGDHLFSLFFYQVT